jgi:hypothetical protein
LHPRLELGKFEKAAAVERQILDLLCVTTPPTVWES